MGTSDPTGIGLMIRPWDPEQCSRQMCTTDVNVIWVLLPFDILGIAVLVRMSRRRSVVVGVPLWRSLNSAMFCRSTRMRSAAEPSLAAWPPSVWSPQFPLLSTTSTDIGIGQCQHAGCGVAVPQMTIVQHHVNMQRRYTVPRHGGWGGDISFPKGRRPWTTPDPSGPTVDTTIHQQ